MPFIAGGLALVLLGAVLGAAGAIAWLPRTRTVPSWSMK